MKFAEAYEAMKQGAKVRCPEWAGYWKWEDESIKMYCKNGDILDIRQTVNVDYTITFMLRTDWEIVDVAEVQDLDVQTFTFGEALRRMKNGQKVCRKGWNGKGQYVFIIDPYCNDGFNLTETDPEGTYYKYMAIKTNYNAVVPWVPSQTDALAEDWILVEE